MPSWKWSPNMEDVPSSCIAKNGSCRSEKYASMTPDILNLLVHTLAHRNLLSVTWQKENSHVLLLLLLVDVEEEVARRVTLRTEIVVVVEQAVLV